MARLAAPTATEPTALAVIADPHVSTRQTGGPRRLHRTEGFLEEAIADINSRDVDLVVSVGDLTIDAARWDFDRFDELIADLDPPFRSVPGNHDVEKDAYEHDILPFPQFVERYTPGTLPFRESVGEFDVIGLNTAKAPDGRLSDSSAGFVSSDQLDWLSETLPSSRQPIVLLHHNLPDYAGQFPAYQDAIGEEPTPPPVLRNPAALVGQLDAGDVPLVVSGHLHVPGIGRERNTTEVAAPSLCMFPQAYLLVDVDRRGTTVRYVPIGSREDSHTGYVLRAVEKGAYERVAIAAINLSRFPLREEWTP